MIKNEVWYTESNKVEVRFLWHIRLLYQTHQLLGADVGLD